MVSKWVRQQGASTGQPRPSETIDNLRRTYGFDQPVIVQYFKWIDGFPSGDFGFSIEYRNAPVADILAQRTGLTVFLGVATLFISWGLAIPFGIFGGLIRIAVGSVIGTLSGYYGGDFDNVVQRVIETIRSFPQLPLWMALAAAIPPQWPPEWVYAGIVVVLAFINWTGLSREARGLVLSLKERDNVHAAGASGASTARTVRKHLIPNMASHIIVTATLAVPVTILGECALSFLGIGVRPPMVSWGLLLSDAIKIQNFVLNPWTLFPGLFILVAAIAYNFLGDGLRDMADPFSR